ncbi:MAG: hypothetical protein HYX22_03620 [Candidatus Yanofskybacteria bacterium]|nr:hypothetical protein [Candidatus Yanofskybacteria bacterium]
MAVVIIPKELSKNQDLIAVPKNVYEEFLVWQKNVKAVEMTDAEKREWKRAKNDYKQGKYLTFDEFKHELGVTRKRKS